MTKIRLLRELRKLLIQPDTRIVTRKLRDHIGNSTWLEEKTDDNSIKITKLRITVDPRRDISVSTVLHELIHVFISLYSFKLSKELEEDIVYAYEMSLMQYIQLPSNEKLLESWTKAVQRKLGK